MIIGIDMLGMQSPDSRMRGIGRYCFHLLRMLFERHAEHEYILYRHEGLPSDGLPEPRLGRWLDLPGALPTRRDAPAAVDMDHLTWSNPDGLDVMLIPSPFEWQNRFIPPARGLSTPKTAVIVYDLIPMQFQEKYLTDPATRDWFTRWTKLLTAQDLLLTISESTRTDVLEILGLDPRRVLTIGTASDPDYFTPDPEGRTTGGPPEALRILGIERPFLFNLSGDDDRKNALGLVEAFARLPRRLQVTHQLVISCKLPPSRVETIRNLARERGVLDQVVLTGPVSEEALRLLYRHCAVFVFPSVYEGFGLPILEAMHCGAPVIAGRNSSQIEIVEGAGLLINATDAAQLAEKIELVLEGPDLANRLREQSLARAGEFDWAHVVDRLAGALEKMVAAEKGRGRLRPVERKRIAIVAPAEFRSLDQSRAAERLAVGLLDSYAIDIYHDSPQFSPIGLRSDRVGCYHHSLFDRNASYKRYRAVFCHLGDAPEFRFVLDFLETHRAIAVLHDLGLARLHLARSALCGGVEAFLDVMRSCYGRRAESIIPVFDRLSHDPDALLRALDTLGVALHRPVFECAEAVVVTSASPLGRSRELTPELVRKAMVIPSGVDACRSDAGHRDAIRKSLGLAPETLVVGVFGSIHTGRRADVLLDAFRDLGDLQPDAHLLLVSTDPIPTPLFVRSHGFGGGRVRVLGRRSLDERDELMAAVDVAVLSQEPGPLGEPLPMLATLLAVGVPTILDDTMVLDRDLEPFVLRCDLTNAGHAGLLGPLSAIAKDPTEASIRASSARELVMLRRGWTQVVSSYRELIERRGAGRPQFARPPHFRIRPSQHPTPGNRTSKRDWNSGLAL